MSTVLYIEGVDKRDEKSFGVFRVKIGQRHKMPKIVARSAATSENFCRICITEIHSKSYNQRLLSTPVCFKVIDKDCAR